VPWWEVPLIEWITVLASRALRSLLIAHSGLKTADTNLSPPSAITREKPAVTADVSVVPMVTVAVGMVKSQLQPEGGWSRFLEFRDAETGPHSLPF
jgi:hypothetical protein